MFGIVGFVSKKKNYFAWADSTSFFFPSVVVVAVEAEENGLGDKSLAYESLEKLGAFGDIIDVIGEAKLLLKPAEWSLLLLLLLEIGDWNWGGASGIWWLLLIL